MTLPEASDFEINSSVSSLVADIPVRLSVSPNLHSSAVGVELLTFAADLAAVRTSLGVGLRVAVKAHRHYPSGSQRVNSAQKSQRFPTSAGSPHCLQRRFVAGSIIGGFALSSTSQYGSSIPARALHSLEQFLRGLLVVLCGAVGLPLWLHFGHSSCWLMRMISSRIAHSTPSFSASSVSSLNSNSFSASIMVASSSGSSTSPASRSIARLLSSATSFWCS